MQNRSTEVVFKFSWKSQPSVQLISREFSDRKKLTLCMFAELTKTYDFLRNWSSIKRENAAVSRP